jgi:histidine triad (HIT) family protein
VSDCVFCRIVKGEIPCAKLFENERVLAFMDVNPVATGHVLVIPKAHSSNVADMSDCEVAAVASALKALAPAVMKATRSEGYNILNNYGAAAGQAVEHVHFHIIPRIHGDGRGYRWITTSADPAQLARLASEISKAIL